MKKRRKETYSELTTQEELEAFLLLVQKEIEAAERLLEKEKKKKGRLPGSPDK